MDDHPKAKFIVETLVNAGFIAYYAGGWVRDFLLQHPSDDIDIATNASPETVQTLFPHTVPIGIAFGIVLVLIEGHPYEVATFRKDLDYRDGRRPSRIEFATAFEDAQRRDFTINGMFYDPLTEQIFDYVDGQRDLNAKIIRAIGNPHERIKEDRLRMMRAVRLACRFGFEIEEHTEQAIRAHAAELFPAVAIERVWQELVKGHDFGKLPPMLLYLHELGLLSSIFPSLQTVSSAEINKRLAPLSDYPAHAPVIASLLPLFPDALLAEQLALCAQFKLSQLDQQFVTFLFQARELCQLKRLIEKAEWAHFYANRFASTSLEIIRAHLPADQRAVFWEQQEEQKKELAHSIQRIEKRDPVVKAEHLLKAGVQPGVAMGQLLKEAERISINEQIDNPSLILDRLKSLPLWPR